MFFIQLFMTLFQVENQGNCMFSFRKVKYTLNIYVLTRKKKKIFEKSGQEVDYSVTRGTES